MATPQDALITDLLRARFQAQPTVDLGPPRLLPPPPPDRRVHMAIRMSMPAPLDGSPPAEIAFEGRFEGDAMAGILQGMLAGLATAGVAHAAAAPQGNDVRAQRVVPRVPVPPGEIHFTEVAGGQLRCDACQAEIDPHDIGPHVLTHRAPAPPNGGAAVNNAIDMRRAPPEGEALDAVPIPPQDLALLGTVEDARAGVVRVDGAVAFENGRCLMCQAEVPEAERMAHATGHRSAPNP